MLAIVISVILASTTGDVQSPSFPAGLGAALAKTRSFAAGQGEALWPGYGTTPFGFLLVTKEAETLLCQPTAPSGFTSLPIEPATGCKRWSRPASGLPSALLAAMPVFGPPSTIVMGTPLETGRSQAEWTRTILHEHFHQYQSGLPNYYNRALALGLAPPGDTGMWMLKYPFPYADPAVGTAYAEASIALADALDARGKPGFLPAFDRYLSARQRFAQSVSAKDWSYIEFQLWQEGVARWTELTLGAEFPDPTVRAAADDLLHVTLAKLRNPDLKAQGRELAYPYGAGEAMLMSSCGPAWRHLYPTVLATKPLLNLARSQCKPQ